MEIKREQYEAYELLIPEKNEENIAKNEALRHIVDTVEAKKALMRQKSDEVLNDLMLEIIKNYEK